MNIQQTNLIKMVRCVIQDAPCDTLTSPDYAEITLLASNHKLTCFLFEAIPHLQKSQLPDALTQAQWKQMYRKALVIEANQRFEYDRLMQAFDRAEMEVLPVKGFLVADCYPKPFLRMMSDLDILYDAEKSDVLLALMQSLGYAAKGFGNGSTDQFFSDTGLHVEMHRSLYEDRMPEAAKGFVESLFERGYAPECSSVYHLSAEDQYIYLLLHTYKHFVYAGTGIRSALDIFVYKNKDLDRTYLENKFKEFGIKRFSEEFERLSEVWFGDESPSDVTDALGGYISEGGVYGSEENKIHTQMVRANNGRGTGKLVYVLRRFFHPYRAMKLEYPILKKLPVLLPFFWLFRAFYAVFRRRSKLFAEVKNVGNYDNRQADRISELMKQLEIH